MERRTYAILLAYDGGPYKGWQPQPSLPTVGGVFTAALHRAGVRATPFGASRTDAGVNARGQVASFSSRAGLSPQALHAALQAELPTTVQVRAVRIAHRSFHAHWSSIGKIYRYRISFTGEARAWRLPSKRHPYDRLDPARLAAALGAILAAPDVSALSRDRERVRRRSIDRADVLELDARGATIELQAAGFGKYLVRHLVAAVLGHAVGALALDEVRAMLTGAAPRPPRAAPEGLTLHRVLYPPRLDPFPDYR